MTTATILSAALNPTPFHRLPRKYPLATAQILFERGFYLAPQKTQEEICEVLFSDWKASLEKKGRLFRPLSAHYCSDAKKIYFFD